VTCEREREEEKMHLPERRSFSGPRSSRFGKIKNEARSCFSSAAALINLSSELFRTQNMERYQHPLTSHLERYEEDIMEKQGENQGDQADRRQGRARRSRTKSTSDVRGMFVDLTTKDAAQKATNMLGADPQAQGT